MTAPPLRNRPSLLLVDDSADFLRALARALQSTYQVRTATSVEEASGLLVPPPDAVLLDLRLKENADSNAESLDLLQRLRRDLPHVPVIMVTAYGDVADAVECMQLGAADFIQKGGDVRELKVRIEKALEHERVLGRLQELEQELETAEPRRIVGESDLVRQVKEMVAAVAEDGRVTVLITGETGTGKELVARSIHASGRRASRPFVAVALSSLPASTIESELFGHEAGAFTDARKRHLGLIERAHGGVLFLDEIGELAAPLQVKLLRFLEERVITRVGGREEIPIDLQIVAATNADLEALIREGQFRQDLYYRLKICEIRLPPLRERPKDIVLLAEHYVALLGRERRIAGISSDALEAMAAYDWPGNVRELRNAMEAALLKGRLRNHVRVELQDLPHEILRPAASLQRSLRPSENSLIGNAGATLDEALARAEFEQIELALSRTESKKTEAWKVLGLNDRFALARRVRRLCQRYPELVAAYPLVQSAYR